MPRRVVWRGWAFSYKFEGRLGWLKVVSGSFKWDSRHTKIKIMNHLRPSRQNTTPNVNVLFELARRILGCSIGLPVVMRNEWISQTRLCKLNSRYVTNVLIRPKTGSDVAVVFLVSIKKILATCAFFCQAILSLCGFDYTEISKTVSHK